MTTFATAEERDRIRQELKSRIMNVLPAATYHMDRFLSLVDVTLSDRTPTAAVEVGPQPVLHLNPDFVEEFCQRDEHLLMLIMHELYHVILGHTRLFPRQTPAHNIVFDAVINAMLCQQFSGREYIGFFRKLNRGNDFPGRLLRPPAGWPKKHASTQSTSDAESKVMSRLYGTNAHQITYQEIFDLLQSELPAEMPDDCVLIGDHDGGNLEGKMDDEATGDPLLGSVLRDVTSSWPSEATNQLGRGLGRDELDYLLPKARKPRAEFLVALKRLLDRAGVLRPEGYSPYHWSRALRAEESTSVIPNWRDRRAEGWQALNGERPIMYRLDIQRQRRRWMPQNTAHVYLDISGSMASELPWLSGALDPLEKRGLCRLFVFSTVVDTIKRGRLLRQTMSNTYGTDIGCVYDHILGLPKQDAPKRVVVITDGFTGEPNRDQAAEARTRGIQLFVGLVGDCSDSYLKRYAHVIEQLPELTG